MTEHTPSAMQNGRRLPTAGPLAGLAELPDPAGIRPSAPAEVYAHLSKIEAVRQSQLDALPAVDLDVVAAAHRGCIERILAEVRTALSRLDAGLYGTCAICEREISPGRLELRPWATTCAFCGSLERT